MSGRRPRPAAIPASAAWVIATFLRGRNEFQAFHLGVVEKGLLRPWECKELNEALEDLEALSREYRDYRVADAETAKPRLAEPEAALAQHLKVPQVAKELRVSEQMVRRYCREERLAAELVGGQWYIEASSVELLKLGRVA